MVNKGKVFGVAFDLQDTRLYSIAALVVELDCHLTFPCHPDESIRHFDTLFGPPTVDIPQCRLHDLQANAHHEDSVVVGRRADITLEPPGFQ